MGAGHSGGPGRRPIPGRAHQKEKECQRCVEISPEGRESKYTLVEFATCLGLPESLASPSSVILERKRISANLR